MWAALLIHARFDSQEQKQDRKLRNLLRSRSSEKSPCMVPLCLGHAIATSVEERTRKRENKACLEKPQGRLGTDIPLRSWVEVGGSFPRENRSRDL